MGIENKDIDPHFGNLNQAQFGLDSPAGATAKHILTFDSHPVSGGTPVGKEKPKYANGKDKNITRQNGEGQEVLKNFKDRFVPNADLPTTASAPPGLDLAQIIAEVDPSGKAQVFPNMIKQFAMIKSIMNIAAGGGGASASPSISQQNTFTEAFTEALCILCNKTSFIQVISSLVYMLSNNGITRIDSGYQEIVSHGITNLIQKAIIFGENNIPVKAIPPVVYGSYTPPKTSLLDDLYFISDFAVKQYYSIDTDPYPGYIQYMNQNQTYSYVKRKSNDYPYSSVDNECLAIAEKGISDDLYPYIIKAYIPTTRIQMVLTTEVMNGILIKHKVNYETNAMERALGKNSSTKLMSNLASILGATGAIVDIAQNSFLAKSSLDAGVVGDALGAFSKGMAMAKSMSNMAQSALKPRSPLGNLSAISAISDNLAGAGIIMPEIADAVGGVAALNDIINSRGGPVSGITHAVASVASLSNQISSSGSSISQIHSNALGQSTPSLYSIIQSMRASKFSEYTILSCEEVLKDIGIV